MREYLLLKSSPGAFIAAHPGIVTGAALLLATHINCTKDEEYKVGVGCVKKD